MRWPVVLPGHLTCCLTSTGNGRQRRASRGGQRCPACLQSSFITGLSSSSTTLSIAQTRQPTDNRGGGGGRGDSVHDHSVLWKGKLQALVYDIFPSTTAVFSYAIGSRKLSANEQFFVGAQIAVSLLQTTQIKQGVSFIAANKVDTSTNKTTIV